jgi:hypothetical protein
MFSVFFGVLNPINSSPTENNRKENLSFSSVFKVVKWFQINKGVKRSIIYTFIYNAYILEL